MLFNNKKPPKTHLQLNPNPTIMCYYPLYYHPPPAGLVSALPLQYKSKRKYRMNNFSLHSLQYIGRQIRTKFLTLLWINTKLTDIKIEQLIIAEVQRISEMLGKTFLDCEDIAALSGLGRDNARILMKSKSFPLITVGRRQVVSILAFVTWQMKDYLTGGSTNGYDR